MKRIGIIVGGVILLFVLLFGWWIISRPERGTTGSVSTRFRWLGPNDKIVVDSFNDPKSRASPVTSPGRKREGEGRIRRSGGHE